MSIRQPTAEEVAEIVGWRDNGWDTSPVGGVDRHKLASGFVAYRLGERLGVEEYSGPRDDKLGYQEFLKFMSWVIHGITEL